MDAQAMDAGRQEKTIKEVQTCLQITSRYIEKPITGPFTVATTIATMEIFQVVLVRCL
jgi:hypothetical protein